MKLVFRFARQHKFLATIALLLAIEIASLPVVYWRYSLRNFPAHLFINDFLVPRLVLGRILAPPITEGAAQDYIGNISMNPSKWAEMFPADTILGWRPAANKISRHAFDALYYVTNTQGFAVVERFDEHFAVSKPADTFRVIVIGGRQAGGCRRMKHSRLLKPCEKAANKRCQ